MSANKLGIRRAVALIVAASALTLSMQSTVLADEDDDFEISPVCRAKPWLPVCGGPEPMDPPPQLPFPCDLLQAGCPWWMFD